LKKRIKPLLPTLKEKKRYLAFEVISDEKLNFNQISNQITYKSKEYLGILGSGKAGIQVLKESWDYKKQRGIIRVNNKWVHQLKSCFLFINKIDGKNTAIKSLGLSGILKKAKSKYIAG
jgi:ribonuclease P/MRP protein subunit POP5